MGKVITGATMSIDGNIAGPNDRGFDLLFQWYGNGDVEIPSASPNVPPIRISAASAKLIKAQWENTGALLVGQAPLRHDQRVGRPAPDGRDHRRTYAPDPPPRGDPPLAPAAKLGHGCSPRSRG